MQSAGTSLVILALTSLMITGCQTTDITKYPSAPDQPKTWTAQDIQNTIVVTSVDDAGPGTLRNAIVQANASAGMDKIVFESSEGLYQQPQSIKLSSGLPDITDSLVIDGYIDNMLWKASGVTLDGQGRYQIIRIAKGVNAKIANLTFTAGHAERGGAIENLGNTVLSGVLLTDNRATEFGGAVFSSGSLYLINSTVHHNRAGQAGGGLFHERGYLKVTHATFDGNESPKGGALYSRVEGVLQNSILANSVSEQDCFAETAFAKESTANIIESSHLCGEVFSSADPGLGKLGGYNGSTRTIPVSSRSAAFNWADNAASVDETGAPLVWDQRGNGDPRFALGIADIGAFEVQPRVRFEVDTLSDEDIRGCTSARADCSLRGALQLLNNSDRHQRLGFDAEVFKDGGELRQKSALPAIIRDLTIDASAVGAVVLVGKSKLEPAEGVKLELINIKSR